MQYLTNKEGERVGVFLTLGEWEDLLQGSPPTEPGYDEWFRRAVERGLRDMDERNLASPQEVRELFGRMGVQIDED